MRPIRIQPSLIHWYTLRISTHSPPSQQIPTPISLFVLTPPPLPSSPHTAFTLAGKSQHPTPIPPLPTPLPANACAAMVATVGALMCARPWCPLFGWRSQARRREKFQVTETIQCHQMQSLNLQCARSLTISHKCDHEVSSELECLLELYVCNNVSQVCQENQIGRPRKYMVPEPPFTRQDRSYFGRIVCSFSYSPQTATPPANYIPIISILHLNLVCSFEF